MWLHMQFARKTVDVIHGNWKDDRMRSETASKENMTREKKVLPEVVVPTFTNTRSWLRYCATSLKVAGSTP
jgi:hypothetical protein